MFFDRITATLNWRFKKNHSARANFNRNNYVVVKITNIIINKPRKKKKAKGQVNISVVFISYDHRND